MRKIFALLIILTLFFCACQPTPEEEFVQSKNNAEFNEKIGQTGAANELAIPAAVSDSIQKNNLTININAEISVPAETSFPVIYAEPFDISQAQADLILDKLIGDAQLTSMRAADEFLASSKETIINRLAELKLLLQDEETKKDSKQTANINQEIADLEQQLKTARDGGEIPISGREFFRPEPVENNAVISEEELASMSEEDRRAVELEMEQSEQQSDFMVIEGTCDLGKTAHAVINICKADNPVHNYVRFVNLNKDINILDNPENVKEISLEENMPGVNLSAKEGYDLALNALSAMNISGVELMLAAAFPLGHPQTAMETWGSCYGFIFSRPVSGIPSTYALADGQDTDYVSEVWKQEYIRIYVDGSGIIGFSWNGPAKIGETLNNSVALKPFDEIMAVFNQQIINKCVFSDEIGVTERNITIDKITLGMMKIKQQNTGKYMYVPVWDFFGYSVNTYDSNATQYLLDESGQRKIDRLGHSYLTINAIDGSVINRSLGY